MSAQAGGVSYIEEGKAGGVVREVGSQHGHGVILSARVLQADHVRVGGIAIQPDVVVAAQHSR